MNQYRNYGNYGNNMRMMQQNRGYGKSEKDCGCVKTEVKHEQDCGCKKEPVMSAMDCGCMKKEEVKDKNCGCKEKDDDKYDMDCECVKKHEHKEDCDCHAEKCGCTVEAMYREMKQGGGMCCEKEMPWKALAMAYVPWQSWGNLYEICEGFAAGTIFRELNLEFYGRRCN